MNLLDLLLIAAAIAFGVTGYRQGFLAGLLSFLGFLGGGLLGLNLVPRLLGNADAQTGIALVAIGLVLVLASVGQLLAGLLGGWLRSRVTWESAQTVDAAGGAFLSVVSMLLVAWFIGSAVATSSMPNLARLFRDSSIHDRHQMTRCRLAVSRLGGSMAKKTVLISDARKGVRELDVTHAEAERLGGRQVKRRGRRPKEPS